MRTVLFVCHANTCRSVMAHVLLEKMLRERAVNGAVRVCSAGVGNVARDGMIPSLDARIVLREDGIHLAEDTITSTDLRRHRHLVREADLILTMTESQRALVASFLEADGRPLFTLREFAGDTGDIEDPVLQGEAKYRACRDEIHACLERSLERLLTLLEGARLG
ncbi:MAG: low molecular weight protein arginine phosphatase [Candidatus Rokuibacteriota bacterium]